MYPGGTPIPLVSPCHPPTPGGHYPAPGGNHPAPGGHYPAPGPGGLFPMSEPYYPQPLWTPGMYSGTHQPPYPSYQTAGFGAVNSGHHHYHSARSRPYSRGKGRGTQGSTRHAHFECKVCSKEYKSEETYTAHLQSHRKVCQRPHPHSCDKTNC